MKNDYSESKVMFFIKHINLFYEKKSEFDVGVLSDYEDSILEGYTLDVFRGFHREDIELMMEPIFTNLPKVMSESDFRTKDDLDEADWVKLYKGLKKTFPGGDHHHMIDVMEARLV